MRGERGQAVIELGVTLLLLTLLTGGSLDVSRAFYQYNVVAAAAGFGARWASVTGGLCSSPEGASTADWCDQNGTTTSAFWAQSGNKPLQSGGTPCPSSYDGSFTGYYTVANFTSANSTTVVGAIAKRYDTSDTSSGYVVGSLVPGLNLSELKVCIQFTWDSSTGSWATAPGDKVTVVTYYPYRPVTALLGAIHQVNLVASAEYRID